MRRPSLGLRRLPVAGGFANAFPIGVASRPVFGPPFGGFAPPVAPWWPYPCPPPPYGGFGAPSFVVLSTGRRSGFFL